MTPNRFILQVSLLAALVGCVATPGTGPGNGTPATGTPTLSREALAFNAGGDVPNDVRTLTLGNPGSEALELTLSVTGANAAQFGLSSTAVSLEAGGSAEVSVTFTPSADLGPETATLVVAGGAETQEVELGGLSVRGQEGTNEPSLQWILDTLGLTVQTGDPDPATSQLVVPGTESFVGDEVAGQLFTRADPTQPVTVEVVAAFGVADVAPVFTFGTYAATAGTPALQELLRIPISPNVNGQRLEPIVTTATGTQTGVISFEPPAETFGFYSFWPTTRFFGERTVYTEDARNTFDPLAHHVRAYPLRDRSGATVPDAFVLATDESNRLGDYNDAVVVVRNVRSVAP